jgi:glycogen synthase
LDARIPDGLTAIRQGWHLPDILHAHDWLDEMDAAQARTEARLKAEQKAAQAAAGMRR